MKNIQLGYNKKNNVFFMVTFPYDDDILDAIRKIPNRRFDKKSKSWLIQSDHSVVRYIEVFAQYFGFEVSDDARALLNHLKQPATEDIILPPIKGTLRQFQKLGVAYATKYERCLIADEMGLGKTLEAIVSVETLNAYPCLILCPASIKLNWQREISTWTDRTSVVIDGLIKETKNEKGEYTSSEIPNYNADYVIINYDILSTCKKVKTVDKKGKEKIIELPTHEEELLKFGFKSIILDEFHMCKNSKSMRTKSAKRLASKIRYRFGLTGTPILNKPKELIPQLDILGRLDYFGGFWTFAKKYCGAKETNFGWDFSGATNLDELNEKMKSICFIRRLKSDVLTELPAKQKTFIPIEIDNRREYNTVERDFINWIKTNVIKPDTYEAEVAGIKNLTAKQKKMLIEAKMEQRLNRAKTSEAMIKIEYLKQVVADGKISRFKEFIDNVIEQGNKLVVFASHTKIQRELYEHYRQYNAARIFKDDSIALRQENVDRFQNDANCPLIIVSLAAGGVGITLTAASRVAFMEFGWTPAIHDQAEDRCHRIGQKDCVNAYYFYGKNTIDEDIMALIEKKRAIALNISDGVSMEAQTNDIDDILKKFM